MSKKWEARSIPMCRARASRLQQHRHSVLSEFIEVIASSGKILAFLFVIILIAVMGNSQQAAGAESTGSLLDAVRSFDKNRIEQLSKKPEWKVSLAETDAEGNGPLHIIAKVGHYKYPPAGIPKLLIESGIDINARNYSGVTALEISLLTGWQKIAILLLDSGALRNVVTSDTKSRIKCPDCKKVVRDYEL